MPVVVLHASVRHRRGANGVTEVGIVNPEVDSYQHGAQNSSQIVDFVATGLAKIRHVPPWVDVGTEWTGGGERLQGNEMFRRDDDSCLGIQLFLQHLAKNAFPALAVMT